MHQDQNIGKEHRKYIRLSSVFPVQFRLMSPDGKKFLCGWLQGFTNNVSKGGLCLSVNDLSPELVKLLHEGEAKVYLDIEIPVFKSPVSGRAKIAWLKHIQDNHSRHLIGLIYEDVDLIQSSRIVQYALAKKVFLPAVVSLVLVLGIALGVNGLLNYKLAKGNKALVEQLMKVSEESSLTRQRLQEISGEREGLQKRIRDLGKQIIGAEKEKTDLDKDAGAGMVSARKKIEELTLQVENFSKDKAILQEQLSALERQESNVTTELARLGKKKTDLARVNFEKMYSWLAVHQNSHNGLVISFEGDNDVKNWAFIYDQSLAAQAYTYFNDFERTKKVMNFFLERAQRQEGLFYNAYFASDGTPAEYIINSGPNIWLGIAIVQYAYRSKDYRYIGLAEDIARGVLRLQDEEGGIRGSPDASWYATEHNLDAYAFFTMLSKVTAKPKYSQAASRVLTWLKSHTYDQLDVPVKRGKGDATIATDTYAWSIAAVTPQELRSLGMNPDQIMDFAEQNCSVEVEYIRPDGRSVKIRGFDFAPQRNLARGGVVSSEWTAQMIIAYKIMADFYAKLGISDKANVYALKADEYMGQLLNMVISSSSASGQGEGCLPYATQENIDTGHGWSTPKGKSTGSIAGTAYTLFAYYNYNPLKLKE